MMSPKTLYRVLSELFTYSGLGVLVATAFMVHTILGMFALGFVLMFFGYVANECLKDEEGKP